MSLKLRRKDYTTNVLTNPDTPLCKWDHHAGYPKGTHTLWNTHSVNRTRFGWNVTRTLWSCVSKHTCLFRKSRNTKIGVIWKRRWVSIFRMLHHLLAIKCVQSYVLCRGVDMSARASIEWGLFGWGGLLGLVRCHSTVHDVNHTVLAG